MYYKVPFVSVVSLPVAKVQHFFPSLFTVDSFPAKVTKQALTVCTPSLALTDFRY